MNPPRSGEPGQRILLVEDHEATQTTLAQLLRRRGFEIVNARSAAEARQQSGQTSFDVIISDLALPDGDGCDLLPEIRALQRMRIPAIAISGCGMEEDILRARKAGFAQHLTKPINIGALEAALTRLRASS